MELDIYLLVLATVYISELDIYWPLFTMELNIYWSVIATVPSVELDMYPSIGDCSECGARYMPASIDHLSYHGAR